MREWRSLRPLLLSVVLVAAVGLMAAVIVLPRIAPGPERAPSPVTQTRPLNLRHERDVGYTNEYLYDSTYETCEAVPITEMARKLGVPARPLTGIARAFADENYDWADRDGPYHGCLDALIDQMRGADRAG